MKRTVCSYLKAISSILLLIGALGLTAAAGQAQTAGRSTAMSCDDSLKSAFHPDNTRVTLVHSFQKGEVLQLPGAPPAGQGGRGRGRGNAPQTAPFNICVVKLMVGPGNPGPADAPSTSAGIGIEVWLPSPDVWNHRIRVMGGGGFAGGEAASSPVLLAGGRGGISGAYVTASTDTGHATSGGSFLMTPEGKINSTEWRDFADRGIHETAVEAKALSALYYGQKQRYAYFVGCSTGGRQGLKEAQAHPEDFDGILAGAPAINWTQFIASELYPQIVMQRDLDKVLSSEQLDLVSSAAISACDDKLNGEHDGFITDPSSCRYDATKDKAVLCVSNGGANATEACVTPAQARAFNKIWYGETSDGSVPAPSAANGFGAVLGPKQVWFGLTRGTRLNGLAGSRPDGAPMPFGIATDTVTLNLENPKLGAPSFHNATGEGQNGWMSLRYADLARSAARGKALQAQFSNIDTNNPDLSRYLARGGKLLHYHGLADGLIAPQGSLYYYAAVAAKMGGYDKVKGFYRFYEIPGMGHCNGTGSVNGLEGVSPPANPPLPDQDQLFDRLVAWVEQNKAPEQIVLTNNQTQLSRPICDFPKKAVYVGGDRGAAASYVCR